MNDMQKRMVAAFDLRELTVAVMRQRLVREHPCASAEQIDALLREKVTEPVPPVPPSSASSRPEE